MNKSWFRLLITLLFLTLAGCAFEQPRPRTGEAARALFDLGSMTPGAAMQKDVELRLGAPEVIRKLEDGRTQWVYVKTQGFDLQTLSADNATDYIAEYTFEASGLLAEASYRAAPAADPWLP